MTARLWHLIFLERGIDCHADTNKDPVSVDMDNEATNVSRGTVVLLVRDSGAMRMIEFR
jgi:hypothetical protein